MAAKPITAVKSAHIIQSRHGTPQDTLKVFAINEGTWGDKISIKIEDSNPADRFNLAVFYKDTPVEVFEDLSMDETNEYHVELLINDFSNYITVDDLSPDTGTAEDRPAL